MKPQIESLKAREIIDSRGNPTIEVDLFLSSNKMGRVAVPSGASTGHFEALELRDGDKKYFLGKGVSQAVRNVNEIIAPQLIGKKGLSQKELDTFLIELDGTDNKSNLGANAILGISLAYYSAYRRFFNIPLFSHTKSLSKETFYLPVPMINILNGGAHADNNIDIQEFMIVPLGMNGFKDAIRAACEIFQTLKSILKKNGHITAVGDEGGFAPNLSSNEEALELLIQAIKQAGYKAGEDIFIALDIAASEFYKENSYFFSSENKIRTSTEMIKFYQDLIQQFPIISIEDALDENDWEGWKLLTETIGASCQLVGDDFLVTNKSRLERAVLEKTANAILIKYNQIGTLSETLEAIELAKKSNYGCIISHRSGETEDSFIADFSVATRAGQIKNGSVCRSERLAKYNQLLRIENNYQKQTKYLGKEAFSFLV